ncbi:hypothetical protein AXF42_Ash007317 [Apostasia shenzhenica]|uniref:VOC domain-containing protein n=1 Tax=Apostasia shenzhenica TaxID=1088818 RepID=A0A2I0B9X8_9ASPA|nr:hypothetical protein AXF42_Ash007317 [Apostasia shenzhenica]
MMLSGSTKVGSAAGTPALPLASLNHISLVCRSVEESLDFYQNVLGFFPIRRPGSFDFDGAWLFNYGIGIHLLQSEDPDGMSPKVEINPKDSHISFQCENLALVEKKLMELGIRYVQRTVGEGCISVDQIFFHDPDGFMIEICNCENLPVVPLFGGEPVAGVCNRVSCLLHKQNQQQQQQQLTAAQFLSPALIKQEPQKSYPLRMNEGLML